jgi:hypothetical protein
MTYDEAVRTRINEIKSIVEKQLSLVSNAIQQKKTFDELIKALDGLIGPSVMTRNLLSSVGFLYSCHIYAATPYLRFAAL